MLKNFCRSFGSFFGCRSTSSFLIRTLYVTTTGCSGEETKTCPETTAPDRRMRRITPKQLSIAVSKRKKRSRPLTESPQNDLKSNNIDVRNKVPRTVSNGIHELHLRYDKTPIAERDALLSYVSEKLGGQRSITRPFQDAYTAPSIIGMSEEDVDDCFVKLLEVGFNKQEAAAILPYLPSCLVMNFEFIRMMCELLERYGIGWRFFLHEHCHCLLNPTTIIKKNLAQMKKIGMTTQVMGWVLRNQPMLFTCSLRPEAIEEILKTKAQGFDCMWVDNTVRQALMNRPAKVSLGPDTKQLVHILKKFGVSPEFVLRRYPGFFNMEASYLLSILEVLCGEPMYIDNTLIAQILTICPQHISSLTSLEHLEKHLNSLCKILTATLSRQYVVRHLSRTPSLISPSLAVEEKVAVFKKAGFNTNETSAILNRAPSVLTQSTKELETRLSLLLSLSDSSPEAIAASAQAKPNEISAGYLTKSVPDLQSRINYSKRYNEMLCSARRLNDLFGTSDKAFASQFGHTVAQYLKEAMENDWLDKKIATVRISKIGHNSHTRKGTKKMEADSSEST